jgi:hypothetical protein
MGFWFKQIFAGRRPVGDYIYKYDDIIFVAGSGLECWQDQQLQPICKRLPTCLKSSFELTDLLKNLPDLPEGVHCRRRIDVC